MLSLFNNTFSQVISIDGDYETVRFYVSNGKDYSVQVEMYKAKPFTDEFYEVLKNVVKLHAKTFTGRTALVLPNNVVFSDLFKVPVMQKRAMENSLDLAIATIYNNYKDIKFNNLLLGQNKQTALYNVFGVQKEVLAKTVSAVNGGGANVSVVSFAGNTAVQGAIAVYPKLRNATFILLDIKEKTACYSFVTGGKTIGFYNLPFGYGVLSDSVVKSECELFDHTPADLLVLNAKEKAKRKELTTFDYAEDQSEVEEKEITDLSQASPEEENEFYDEDEEVRQDAGQRSGALFRRVNRKLPKFMQRPEPIDANDFVFENFRPFIKWGLELVRNNPDLTTYNKPEAVYVNMPEKFGFLYDVINAEKEENGLAFLPLSHGLDDAISENLELYGATHIKRLNKLNNF